MTEANLLINLRKLESLNFISRKAGKRKEASEYVIYENTINSYVEIPMKVKNMLLLNLTIVITAIVITIVIKLMILYLESAM